MPIRPLHQLCRISQASVSAPSSASLRYFVNAAARTIAAAAILIDDSIAVRDEIGGDRLRASAASGQRAVRSERLGADLS